MADKQDPNISVLDTTLSLPPSSHLLLTAKATQNLTFATIGSALGQSEVFAAALFYGQARASSSDISTLSSLLSIPEPALRAALAGFPNRGSVAEMPPTEPFVYRLYEIVRNYGYVYKAVVNERFGDGIMSAVSFKTEVGREVDEKGAEWVVLTLRGKWLPFSRF